MASCNVGPDGNVPKTDANGSYTLGDVSAQTRPHNQLIPTHFQINLEGATHQTFKGIKASGDYTSEEQKVGTKGQSFESFPSLPFDGTGDFFSLDDRLIGQLSLVNSSTLFAYTFSSMRLYTDLDPLYFNAQDFASDAAVASGVLALDVVSVTGNTNIPMAGQESSPVLTFSTNLSDPSRYLLLDGLARPILSDGTLGDEFSFAVASRPVPEPTTFALWALGLGGYFATGYRWLRRPLRQASRSPLGSSR